MIMSQRNSEETRRSKERVWHDPGLAKSPCFWERRSYRSPFVKGLVKVTNEF